MWVPIIKFSTNQQNTNTMIKMEYINNDKPEMVDTSK